MFYNMPTLIEDSTDYEDDDTEFEEDINTANGDDNRNASEGTASASLPGLPR